jgi:hypothetical protein
MAFLSSLTLVPALPAAAKTGEALRMSVYCTAGDVQRHLASEESRQEVLHVLRPLRISRLFLEGRRGDEDAPPNLLREVRRFFNGHGIECTGGIATVPGAGFGTRQDSALGWLNWESAKTQEEIARFFTGNAPVFDELIVDDFYCTADTSAESARARGTRSWGEYRRDLLVSLIQPMMLEPARRAKPDTRFILKFPQWYDRFHLFGYDPARMIPQFDRIWVGTEVRDPKTRRMGFVQPTEGYMNFRWLASQAPGKVRGAWFDHIECSAQNFMDQACQSVLAGAAELTLFHLGDLVERHPGDTLLAAHLPELADLSERVRHETRNGIVFYKPSGSESSGNLYLADYLGMIGLPILPEAEYPMSAKVAILPVQAAADPGIILKMRRHLERGATLVLTPAFVRAVGEAAAKMAGVETAVASLPAATHEIAIGSRRLLLAPPVEIDAGVKAADGKVRLGATIDGRVVPWLTTKSVGRGQVLVLNVRTFSEQDFKDTGEWLLAPRALGLPEIPQELADELRSRLTKPLGLEFRAPAGVSLSLFQDAWCACNFHSEPVVIRIRGRKVELPANGWVWRNRNNP